MKKLFAISVLALLASCSGTSVHRISERSYSFVMPSDVRFYQHDADVPYAFEKLAVIYTSKPVDLEDPGRIERKLASNAADLGANGILVVNDPVELPDDYEGQVFAIKVFYGVARQQPAQQAK